jgi:serine palmitoyltransferase
MLYDRASPDYNHTFKLTGTKTRALNISSYNYLGFAQATGGCADAVETAIKRYGVSAGGARLDAGTLDLHVQTEKLVSQFVGTEDAMVVSMGFATNSTTIPALVEKGCLVISDEFNHSSIRFGVRLSGAIVRQFKHNDMKSLEVLLRESISQGQPRTHRPWKKILVIVEGLYSMEGSLVDLPNLIELKARYKVGVRRSAGDHRKTLAMLKFRFVFPHRAVLPLRRRGTLHRSAWSERSRRL